MDDVKKHFWKALLLICLIADKPISGFKLKRLKLRQNSLCLNQAVGDFVPDLNDCKKFYMCVENGEAVPASCPSHMLFNADTHICDTSDNVRCQQITPATSPTFTTPSTSTESPVSAVAEHCLNAYQQQPNSDSLIFLAHPSNCKQYYMCYYGHALLQECSTDLQWNSRIGKCDLPLNAKCKGDQAFISVPIIPSESSPIEGNPNGNGNSNFIVCPAYGQHIFPHMQRCDFFIYCVKGHVILQQCPFYQYFDVESSRCKGRRVALCIKDLQFEYRKNSF
ncbi:putative chitinase 10 [Cochliomyia hominivorax]